MRARWRSHGEWFTALPVIEWFADERTGALAVRRVYEGNVRELHERKRRERRVRELEFTPQRIDIDAAIARATHGEMISHYFKEPSP
ncbi:MAG: hypothetical protein ACYDC2_03275 [Solirubrobacteraceae bacterium]